MEKHQKILITGATGMVGSSLVRILKKKGFKNLITIGSKDIDLRNQIDVENFFKKEKPEYVFHLAAIVGGIHANNTYPAKFIYDNTQMHLNVIHFADKYKSRKVLFPGSACTYPKLAKQPIEEKSFLCGSIEPTNIAYASAKINGIVAAQSYQKEFGLNVSIPMPTNSYGIGDNFDPDNSHVIPALIRRFHNAKINNISSVTIWGSGNVLREFIYVDDFADGLIFLIQNYDDSNIINLSTMDEISIKDLSCKISNIIGYKGNIEFDSSKPDGAPRKCLDASKIKSLGWKSKISLEEGLERTYKYYLSHIHED